MRIDQLNSGLGRHHGGPALLQRLRLRTRLDELSVRGAALLHVYRRPVQARLQPLHHVHDPAAEGHTVVQVLFRDLDVAGDVLHLR